MAMTINSGMGKTIQAIFTPAIVLMNRLGYTRKFALLWLMSLIAVAVVVNNLYVSLDREIRFSQRELEGIALAAPVSRSVQFFQQHRGLSKAVLGGYTNMRDMRAAKEQEASDVLDATEKKLPPNLASSEDWLSIKANWARLQKEGLNWTADENFAMHTRLIDQLLIFKIVVSGEYVLSLDPQINSAYLIDVAINRLRMALEHLGQARAYGTDILSRKHITEQQKVTMKTLIAQFGDQIKFIQIDFDKVALHNPALRDALSAASGDINASARHIAELVESDILSGNFATSPEDFYMKASTAIDNGYAQMYESLLPKIEALIKARIAHAENVVYTSIGIAFLLFLAAADFSIGIYYATIDSIRSLARSARAFAGGDMRERVCLDTRDELSQVGDSFNEMADGFNAMLESRKQAERALMESRERLYAVIETALDAVVQMNAEGIITGWNPQAENIFGWTREEAIGRTMHETIIPSQYREAHAHGLKHFLSTGEKGILNSRVETLALHRDGHEFPVELSITSVKMGNQYEFNGFIHDITNRKKAEDLIWRQANFDKLTGLPNRHMFYDRLAQETRKADRTAQPMALLCVDLDRFKEINDTLGHSMGDILLVEAARRIGACVRESTTVARVGGDDFIIILAEPDEISRVDVLTQNILNELAKPFRLESEVVYLSASIGITLYPHDAIRMEELLKNAEQAMYAAKNEGRNRFSYFTQSMQQAAQAHLRWANDLRSALAAGQFRVYYQPIVELATGRIYKAEALIRWQHPVHGLVSPVEFIPLAEETGLIVGIGDWVFREAAHQVKRWRSLYDPEFQVSVNESPVQFYSDDSTCQTWPAYLRELELPGQSLVIEITEGLLLEAKPGVRDKLRLFRDAGIPISLDDFGTGYSSLSYLQKFDIDYLKIDQSFTCGLEPGSSSMALSEAIIMMAHRLGMKVIAEGVETEAQRTLLAAAGCDYGQGYLFSRPVPAEKFEELLNKRSTGE
jgi:diguanylate cyclase (GGDEF)-like protein/PAS domain S-box-containing protein